MSATTAIEWTERTWNPTTGCDRVSPGCANCYAMGMAKRLKAMGRPEYQKDGGPASGPGFGVSMHPERLSEPLKWRKPSLVFVDSMSDLFHEEVPDGFIAWVWLTMARSPQHTYQILTKRPERMRDWFTRWNDVTGEDFSAFKDARGPEAVRAAHPSPRGQIFAAYLEELAKPHGGVPPEGAAWPTFDWLEGEMRWGLWPLRNVWLGVSAENQRMLDTRVPLLLETPAAVRFVSAEPLVGPLDLRSRAGRNELCIRCGEGPEAAHEHTDGYRTRGIDWVIVGGESGAMSTRGGPERALVERCDHRVMADGGFNASYANVDCGRCGAGLDANGNRERRWVPKASALEWVRSIRDQCESAGVAFLLKQWGGPRPKSGGRVLDGKAWHEFPVT